MYPSISLPCRPQWPGSGPQPVLEILQIICLLCPGPFPWQICSILEFTIWAVSPMPCLCGQSLLDQRKWLVSLGSVASHRNSPNSYSNKTGVHFSLAKRSPMEAVQGWYGNFSQYPRFFLLTLSYLKGVALGLLAIAPSPLPPREHPRRLYLIA